MKLISAQLLRSIPVPDIAQITRAIDSAAAQEIDLLVRNGQVVKISGQLIEVSGCDVGVGAVCNIDTEGNDFLEAEVIGFSGERTFLMAFDSTIGVMPKARVHPKPEDAKKLPQLSALLGRVLDGQGRPLDGRPLECRESQSFSKTQQKINPLKRQKISKILDVGVRAVNALLSVGVGQRIGLFAGSGVGKSVMLGLMARYTSADVTVVGLIGERGREVQEFVAETLGEEGLKRSVVVASPGDDSPVLRRRAAFLATEIAERFRDEGKQVLLLMDSLSRVAQAQREIGLNLGESPATKGYTPSVFSLLPKLVERAGNVSSGAGSITAIYTVLAEGDDEQDPIVDSARAILDGHIILSRRLADSGHYPAIEISSSISRTMPRVCTEEHLEYAREFKELWAKYTQQEDLISIGAYVPGSDALTDKAIALRPKMLEFLRQGSTQAVDAAESIRALTELMKPQLNSALAELGEPNDAIQATT